MKPLILTPEESKVIFEKGSESAAELLRQCKYWENRYQTIETSAGWQYMRDIITKILVNRQNRLLRILRELDK